MREHELESLRRDLVLGATISGIVDWQELSGRIARSPPPLPEREYCERILRIANGEMLTLTDWYQLVGLSLVDRRNKSGSIERAFRASGPQLKWLRGSLCAYIEGSETTKKAMSTTAARDLNNNRVLIFPSYSAEEGRQDRVITTGVNSALAYGLWLLFDSARGYACSLRQCRYSECLNFFFKRAETGGAPVRFYCRDEHAEFGIRERARQRMQKLRTSRK